MIITVLTDFGTADGYAAEVQGTLLRLAPGVVLAEVSHDIAPGDIAAGAYALGRAWSMYPEGTIHLAVVDPGVGTARRGLAVEAGGHWFVGPDNGLLEAALAVDGARSHALLVPPTASRTFHGRDVFAPAAAALARGEPGTVLGASLTDPVRAAQRAVQRAGGDLVGEVIHVDRFGTLITNLPEQQVARGAAVRIGVYDLVVRDTFGDVAPGELVAFFGSGGTLEIAVRDGRADTALGLSRRAEVRAAVRR